MSNLVPLDSFFNSLYATNLFLLIIIVFFLANIIHRMLEIYSESSSIYGMLFQFALSIFLALVVMLMILNATDSLIIWITSNQNAI